MIDAYVLWSVVVFFLLQIVAAFFSLAETALLSLTRSQISEIKEQAEENVHAARLDRLLGDPRRFLIFILAGNTVVNVLSATVAALATSHILEGNSDLEWIIYVVQGVAVAAVLLIMGGFCRNSRPCAILTLGRCVSPRRWRSSTRCCGRSRR
ncbi:MAG: DUF21 domain-containing protein [bacterium]|nr:DUF21 domain-containing protein [bacterium]